MESGIFTDEQRKVILLLVVASYGLLFVVSRHTNRIKKLEKRVKRIERSGGDD